MASQPESHTHYRDQLGLAGAATTPTLFGLPNLLHPSQFTRLANDAVRECDAVRRTLASSLSAAAASSDGGSSDDGPRATAERVRRAKRTLHLLDDISNIVCTVIDAAELCRSVHASPEWRRGAGDAFGILSGYIGSLNADESLYLSLRRFVFLDEDGTNHRESDANTVMSQLPPEYQRMAHAMRREFERDGIHLQYTQREEARELINVIVGLEGLFTSNITEKTKYFEIEGKEMVKEVDRILPRHVLGQLVRTSVAEGGGGSDDRGEGSVTLSSDHLLCNTLMARSPSPSLRKEVYLQSHTAVPENLEVSHFSVNKYN